MKKTLITIHGVEDVESFDVLRHPTGKTLFLINGEVYSIQSIAAGWRYGVVVHIKNTAGHKAILDIESIDLTEELFK